MAESNSLKPCASDIIKWPPNGHPKQQNRRGFLASARNPAKMFRVGLYARVSTHDQQTLPLQMRAMREYASKRGWMIAVQIKEVGSGAVERELREQLLAAARRREIDVVLVWRLDRWGRSLVDLVVTLKELAASGRRLRISHRSAGSDDADRSGHGRAAVCVCGVRTRDPSRAYPRGYRGSAPAGHASRSARHGGEKSQPDRKASPCWCQQSRNRQTSRNRPHVRTPHTVSKTVMKKAAKDPIVSPGIRRQQFARF